VTATVPSSTLLSALATAYSNAAQSRTSIETDIINGRMQQQLNQKIAALKGPVDTVLIQSNQALVQQLSTKLDAINKLSSQFAANGNVFADLTAQFGTLRTAITNGDAQGFNLALLEANNDVANLTITPPTAPYQPDDIEQLKTNGLGIKNASSYDLSTAAGQAAATTDVQNAQNAVMQASAIVNSNQLVAYANSAALTTQINSLNTTLQEQQNENQTYITTQTNQLTQLEQDQAHLIQLGLANSTALSSALQTATTPINPASSPFDVLGSNSNSSSGSNPAALSLLV